MRQPRLCQVRGFPGVSLADDHRTRGGDDRPNHGRWKNRYRHREGLSISGHREVVGRVCCDGGASCSLPGGTWYVPPIWLEALHPFGFADPPFNVPKIQSNVENSSTTVGDPAQRLLIRATDPASWIIFSALSPRRQDRFLGCHQTIARKSISFASCSRKATW